MMVDYKLCGPDETTGVTKFDDDGIYSHILPVHAKLWQDYLDWKALGNTPDPQYTTEEQAQIDYEARQNARIQNLKSALVNQFKMILELFQVGRDKGLWVVADFDPALVTLAQEWKDLIDDYETDSP